MIAPGILAEAAKQHAHYAHAPFTRRGGEPYTEHLRRVAESVRDFGPEYEAVAWLHDILEDTMTTVVDLREWGFSDDVVTAVVRLTKPQNTESDTAYEFYLSAIKSDLIARTVKIADMLDNLTDKPTQKQKDRYTRGIIFLSQP